MQFNFVLDKHNKKVTFTYPFDKGNLNFLYDTGAEYPIWSSGVALLKKVFNLNDTDKSDVKCTLTGIGGELRNLDVWVIPRLVLHDSYVHDKCITLQNIPVAVADGVCSSDLLLPNTLFTNCHIQINNHESNRLFTIETEGEDVINVTNITSNSFDVNVYRVE